MATKCIEPPGLNPTIHAKNALIPKLNIPALYMYCRVAHQNKIFDLTLLTFIMAVFGPIELNFFRIFGPRPDTPCLLKVFFEFFGLENSHDKG